MKLTSVTLLVLSLLTCGLMADEHKHKHNDNKHSDRREHRQEQAQNHRHDGEHRHNEYRPQRPVVVRPQIHHDQCHTDVVVVPQRPHYCEPPRRVWYRPQGWFVWFGN